MVITRNIDIIYIHRGFLQSIFVMNIECSYWLFDFQNLSFFEVGFEPTYLTTIFSMI